MAKRDVLAQRMRRLPPVIPRRKILGTNDLHHSKLCVTQVSRYLSAACEALGKTLPKPEFFR